jgi:hypothetical protein
MLRSFKLRKQSVYVNTQEQSDLKKRSTSIMNLKILTQNNPKTMNKKNSLMNVKENESKDEFIEIYGKNFHEVYEKNENKIPKNILILFEYLSHERSLSTKNIFKISSQKYDTDELKSQIENNFNIENWKDVHTVSSLLKMFLREMTEPLLLFSQFTNFLQVLEKDSKEQVR